MTAKHFVDFEISREKKDDFLKTTIGHLGMNSSSSYLSFFRIINIIMAGLRDFEPLIDRAERSGTTAGAPIQSTGGAVPYYNEKGKAFIKLIKYMSLINVKHFDFFHFLKV